MDDQQHTPPPYPATPVPPPGWAEHVEPHRPPRARRTVAALGAAALLAATGGVGAGYAIGHRAVGQSTGTAVAGSAQSGVSTDGSGGTSTIPDSGTGPWSGGGGGIVVPGQPFDGYGGQAPDSQSQSSDSTTKASGSQLTGLVRVVSTMKYGDGKAVGTGMVVTSDGEVVTNHHVVAGSTSIKVTVMTTGTTYTAQVVGTDTPDDVAVLQLVDASGMSIVTPDTDGVDVGDAVTAVGDANGTVRYLSAASGSVLAENQSITTQSEANAAGQRLTNLMEISSDVISGDSGGATYDADGEVVGMTTAASSGSANVVGYAVPIAKVLRIADDLDSGVTSSRYDYGSPAFLGVGLGDTTATAVQGVYAGTPAAKAGIVSGDVITAIGSTDVSTARQLHKAVAAHSPGDSVQITWTDASGGSHEATVRLVKGPIS